MPELWAVRITILKINEVSFHIPVDLTKKEAVSKVSDSLFFINVLRLYISFYTYQTTVFDGSPN